MRHASVFEYRAGLCRIWTVWCFAVILSLPVPAKLWAGAATNTYGAMTTLSGPLLTASGMQNVATVPVTLGSGGITVASYTVNLSGTVAAGDVTQVQVAGGGTWVSSVGSYGNGSSVVCSGTAVKPATTITVSVTLAASAVGKTVAVTLQTDSNAATSLPQGPSTALSIQAPPPSNSYGTLTSMAGPLSADLSQQTVATLPATQNNGGLNVSSYTVNLSGTVTAGDVAGVYVSDGTSTWSATGSYGNGSSVVCSGANAKPGATLSIKVALNPTADTKTVAVTLQTDANAAATLPKGPSTALTCTAPAGPSATLADCAGCHNYPPVDSASRNAVSGDFIGDHTKHSAYTCATCHVAPATATSIDFAHRTGQLNMDSGNIGVGADNGTYSKGASFAQSNAPTTGTCSLVDCHNNAVTPQWGVGTTTCSTCHALPPATGAHSKHYTEKGWATGVTTNCTVCHPDNTAGHSDVTDGNKIVNASLTPSGTSPAITCGATPATGCHNGKVTPAWNTTGITCLSCHTVGGAGSNPVSGLHDVVPSVTGQQHDDAFGSGGTCTSCHTTLAAQATHANGTFSGNGSLAGDRTAMGLFAAYTSSGSDNNGSCATTACHLSNSDDWAHQWNDSANYYSTDGSACGGCHGDWARGWNSGVIHRTTANAQTQHGDGGTSYQCYECHTLEHAVYPYTWSTNDWLPNGGTSKHGNSSIEVNSSGTSYNATSGLCTSCHTTADGVHNFADTAWTIAGVAGATITAPCYGCHGGDNAAIGNVNYWPGGAGAAYPDRAGEHNVHIQALAAKLGYPFSSALTDQQQKTMCAYCHPYTTNPGEAGHNDNVAPADVTAAAFNPLWSALTANYPSTADGGTAAAYTPGNGVGGSCAGIDCHNNKTSPTTHEWYDAAASNCAMCHSDVTAEATHTAHTGAAATYGVTVTCANCHDAATNWATNTKPATGHINGTFSVAGSTAFTYGGTYPSVKGSCGTNACHNNGKNAAPRSAYTWGTALAGCVHCHGDTAATHTSEAHAPHLNASSTFGLAIACTNCHAAATAATHVNGTINLPGTTTFTYTGGDVLVTGTTFGTCGTTACHRSDASANTAPAVNPAWNAGALANCTICHAAPPATSKHTQHLASNSLPGTDLNECYVCHNLSATNTGLATGANHLNGVDNVNFNTTFSSYEATTAAVAAGSGATTTCSNVKCHNGVTTPQWSATVTCASCHNTGGTGPLPSAASVIGKHDKHANNDADYSECANCHTNAASYTAVGGHADHQNLTVNLAITGISYSDTNGNGGVNYVNGAEAADADNGTCSNTSGCHGTTGSQGWAAASTLTNGCFACHGGSLTAAETGTGKPAVDTIPNPMNNTQYTTQGHGQAAAFPGSGATGPGYVYTANPGCYTCHSSAAQHSPAASATDPFRLGAYAGNTDGLCLQAGCHDTPTVLTHSKAVTGSTKTWPGTNYAFKCVDCHDPHGDSSYYMIRSHISAPTTSADASFGSDSYGTPLDTANASAVTFTALTGMAANSYGVSGTTNGICEVCHTQTNKYIRGSATVDTHNTTTRCTTCHKHDAGLKGAGCNGCHGGDNAAWSNKNFWPSAGAAYPKRAGEHELHITRLMTKLGYAIATITDQQQKTMCAYCHPYTTEPGESGHGDNVAPADVTAAAFNPIWSALTANYPSTADGGTAAAYTPGNGTGGSCAGIDCHNNKTTPTTHEWYDGATSQCLLCHDRATSGNNPSSGLHYGSTAPTVTGKWHDNTLNGVTTDCLPCHTMPAYAAAGSHMNGTFTGNGTLAGDRTNMGLFASYTTAGTDGQGTCSGAGVGAGCHAGAGDNGSWARKWGGAATPVHYGNTGAECAGCHGGFAGATSWNSGVLSHSTDWDGDATSNEIANKHGADDATIASRATKCQKCHVYADTVNSTYKNNATTNNIGWVGNAANASTYHGNGTLNFDANRSYTLAGGCASSCHQNNTNHKPAATSGWTLANISGAPALACTDCHNGLGSGQFKVGPSSSHTDPDGAGATYAAGGNNCAVCHHSDHAAETTNTVAVTWDTRTMGTSYVTGDGKIHLKKLAGTETYEAEICWNCHWGTNMPSISPLIKEFGPTQGVYQTGTLNQRNWFGATWTSANFAYKTAAINSFHQASSVLTVDPAIDTAHVATDVGTIGCTSCHDVHRVGNNGFTPAGQPYLRGSWTSNPFKEDGAPQSGQTMASNRGAVPRGIGSQAANGIGGWQIEQNNASFANTVYSGASGFAGLCANCHTQTTLEAMTWKGHKGTVSGFTGSTGVNVFRVDQRGGGTAWNNGNMSYAGTTTGRSTTWIGGLRNNRQWVDGVAPRDIDSLQTTGATITYPAGAVTTITFDSTTAQNNFHNFPCSKCHSPHASRLPRLMITNCLDVSHNTWDNTLGNPSTWAGSPGSYTAKQLAYSPTAQNCHRYVAGTDANREAAAEAGWNTVTPW